MDTDTLERTTPAPTGSDPTRSDSFRDMRQNVLAAYLEKIALAGRTADGAAAVALTFGSHRLDLDPWESTVLERALTDGTESDAWTILLAEGLAFQAKHIVDSEKASEPDAAVRDRSLTNAAIGLSLLEETQRAINAMVLSGAIDEAKKLSTFRNKIGHTVSTLKDCLGAEDFERAESMAQEMVPELEPQTSTSRDAPLRFDELPATTDGAAPKARRTARARAVEEKSGDYSRPLLLALAGLAAVWLLIAVPRLTHTSLPVLEQQDLPRHEAIQGISARPPSLYIDIDVEVWNGLGRDERIQLIDEIGSVAAGAGYTGAQFRTSDAGEVGRWLKQRGAELVPN